MTLDEGHYYILSVARTYGKVSLWLWKSLENSEEFFLLLCVHPVLVFKRIAINYLMHSSVHEFDGLIKIT